MGKWGVLWLGRVYQGFCLSCLDVFITRKLLFPIKENIEPPLQTPTNHVKSSSKDSSNRLWDIRYVKNKALMKFKGHQNASRNYIRASFGARDEVVLGGSEGMHVFEAVCIM